jgi:hypothetical protein
MNMSENQRPDPDPLEHAIMGFQHMTVPDRPHDVELLSKLGARSRDGIQLALTPSFLKGRHRVRILATSATAALLVLGSFGLLLLTSTSSIALADIAEVVQSHKLVRYHTKETSDTKTIGAATSEYTVYADLKALRFRKEMRHEFTDADDPTKVIEEVTLIIQDIPNDRHLITNTHPGGKVKPPRKDAWLGRIGEGRKNWKSFLENLQEFEKKKGVTSIKDKLGDRNVMRFRLEVDNRTDSLWVDVKTKLPVRMEMQLADPNPDTTRITFIDTEYEWDPPLPNGIKNLDELFSTTPPEGYTLDDQTKN